MIIELTVLNGIGAFLAHGGYESLRVFINDFFNVDCSAIRAQARWLYGTTDSRGDEPFSPYRVDPAPWPRPPFVVDGDAPAAHTLSEAPEALWESFRKTVRERWCGDAYNSFDDYERALGSAADDEEKRLRAIGDSLVELADALEITQYELAGFLGQAAAVALFLGGLILAPVSGARSLLATIVGAIGLTLGTMTTRLQSLGPRLEASANARLAIEEASPRRLDDDELPVFPTNPGEWVPRTDSPVG